MLLIGDKVKLTREGYESITQAFPELKYGASSIFEVVAYAQPPSALDVVINISSERINFFEHELIKLDPIQIEIEELDKFYTDLTELLHDDFERGLIDDNKFARLCNEWEAEWKQKNDALVARLDKK